jgi:GR25 family glycosyltransferase involved in LPS biosynthesis
MSTQGSFEKISYLINLDKRPDRWNQFLESSSELAIPIRRFSAVDASSLDRKTSKLPGPVEACWRSHQEIAKLLLESSAEHCLILEDDVLINQNSLIQLNKVWGHHYEGIDLLQIGFCVHSNRLADRSIYSNQRRLVKMIDKCGMLNWRPIRKLLKHIYGYEFTRLPKLDVLAATSTFELGTHAYIISRKFAERMVHFNTPTYLPADLALIELAHTGCFASFRLLENLVVQSNSPSSISHVPDPLLVQNNSKLGDSDAIR